MATIKDVARLAGVSVSTISKYLNGGNVLEENAEAIRRAISELDYRVNPFARSLKTQRSKSIGVLLPDITAPFFGNVLTALDKVLRENGYHSLVSCYSSNHGLERDNLSFLLSAGIDGLIYVPEDLSADEFYELTSQRPVPVVQVDRVIQGVATDAVLVNSTETVYTAVSALLDKGHHRIAILTGPKSVFTAKERLIGYLRALSDHDIPYDDALVHSGDLVFSTGYNVFSRLMQEPNPPTAIVCTNYDITMGFITAARERGLKIPQDIDVFGFDSVEICSQMQPPLPVVQQPDQELGRLAATYLIERMNGCELPPRMTRLDCKISV